MGSSVNCARPVGESEIWVTGKREKWTVMWMVGNWVLMEVMRAWVRGSRAVLEEGVRMPRRMRLLIVLGGVEMVLGV